MLQVDRWRGALVGGFVVLVSGCAPPPTDAECGALLDRYTTKLLHANDPELSEGDVSRLRNEARLRAEADPAMSCRNKVSRRQYECAMNAPTADEMEKCLLP